MVSSTSLSLRAAAWYPARPLSACGIQHEPLSPSRGVVSSMSLFPSRGVVSSTDLKQILQLLVYHLLYIKITVNIDLTGRVKGLSLYYECHYRLQSSEHCEDNVQARAAGVMNAATRIPSRQRQGPIVLPLSVIPQCLVLPTPSVYSILPSVSQQCQHLQITQTL